MSNYRNVKQSTDYLKGGSSSSALAKNSSRRVVLGEPNDQTVPALPPQPVTKVTFGSMERPPGPKVYDPLQNPLLEEADFAGDGSSQERPP